MGNFDLLSALKSIMLLFLNGWTLSRLAAAQKHQAELVACEEQQIIQDVKIISSYFCYAISKKDNISEYLILCVMDPAKMLISI
uniref:Secreted protein n=1 Tax=Elaeophora elaphi TaxID=1147741 RepID=A0A0R3RR50_9BILA